MLSLDRPFERQPSGLWLPVNKVQCLGRARQDTPWRVRKLGPSRVELSCEVTFFPESPAERLWRESGLVGWELATAWLNTNTVTHDSASPTSASMSVTNSGANRCAFCMGVFNNATSMSIAATYNSVAMNSAGSPDHNTVQDFWAQILYLKNPATGSNTLTITVTGAVNYVYFNLVGYTGVDQTTQVRAGSYSAPANPKCNGSGNYSITITSQVGDVTATVFHGTAADGVNSTDKTSDGIDNGGGMGMGSDHAAGAASVVHTWNSTANGDVAACGLSIQADGGAAAAAEKGAQVVQKDFNQPLLIGGGRVGGVH